MLLWTGGDTKDIRLLPVNQLAEIGVTSRNIPAFLKRRQFLLYNVACSNHLRFINHRIATHVAVWQHPPTVGALFPSRYLFIFI